jgi:hypothetical protein
MGRREEIGRILVFLADGQSSRDIGVATLASPSLARAVKRDFAAGGLDRVLGREVRPVTVAQWLIVVVRWLFMRYILGPTLKRPSTSKPPASATLML